MPSKSLGHRTHLSAMISILTYLDFNRNSGTLTMNICQYNKDSQKIMREFINAHICHIYKYIYITYPDTLHSTQIVNWNIATKTMALWV